MVECYKSTEIRDSQNYELKIQKEKEAKESDIIINFGEDHVPDEIDEGHRYNNTLHENHHTHHKQFMSTTPAKLKQSSVEQSKEENGELSKEESG